MEVTRYRTNAEASAVCGPGDVVVFVPLNPRTGECCYVVVPDDWTQLQIWEMSLAMRGIELSPMELRMLGGRQAGDDRDR